MKAYDAIQKKDLDVTKKELIDFMIHDLSLIHI